MAGPNWDETEDMEFDDELPPTKTVVEADGTKVVTEYMFNDDGKKVKVVKRIRTKLIKTTVNKAVAERKKWAKFGESAGLPPGPDTNATSLGEKVLMKLSQGIKDEVVEQDAKTATAAVNSNISCRICKGEHWTTKCPYKDTFKPLNELTAPKAPVADAGEERGPSKYISPGARARLAGGPQADTGSGSRPDFKRDEANTIRISNLSEETTENDVRDLISRFGPTSRVYVAIDRDLGICKGFAFISFYDKQSAERAIEKLDGFGYDSLILRADWSKRD
ncbi:eukaryotic translation initiation factor 3 subunit G-domain-containing protein [Entophlyctis helioformis]|nr:eukaryotic translation initiation factor 3 subunit G-domain-containing protein [Entophlyctis helioformis]